MPDDLTYALVTPARNEVANLERLAESVVAQDLCPAAWVVVDDGSDDGTWQLACALAEAHSWIHAVPRAAESGVLSDGRSEGRDLLAFRQGVRALPDDPDVVVKVDADTSFEPDYFRRLIARFAAEPDLGIAGGACYEQRGDGTWARQKVSATHPRGASRAYRRECLPDVMSLAPKMGWDGIDEVKARLRGYRSATVLDLGFRHHRPVGARERDRLAHHARQGAAAWYMGYRPSFLLLRCAYRAVREPAAVGMAWGYAKAAWAQTERCGEPDVVARLRDEQRLRRVLAQGAPP